MFNLLKFDRSCLLFYAWPCVLDTTLHDKVSQ